MKRPANRFLLKPLNLAVIAGLCVPAATALAQSEEDKVIEEVVATGTRLKGTASAVMQERKNQAFVADIMGAEQISRTGDGDAASALRRVTGLTLVDGKFIYVRGLGERYSSTQLNGASVPSPDPTRNVIPLDLFPADIIESLSVQKSFSPSMPASFGGGNVDVRLKSIPTESVLNFSLSTGYNSENSDNGLTYNGGDDDWLGKDDGTRAAPEAILERWESKDFLDNLDQATALDLFSQVKRSYGPKEDSIGPDAGFSLTAGDSVDLTDKWRVGYLLTSAYDSETEVSQEYELQQADRVQDDIIISRFFDEINTTERTVQWSTLLNLGIDYDRKHRIDYSLIVLNDTKDEISEKFGHTENLSVSEGVRIRDMEVQYEERTLYTNQFKGMHTFPELNFAGLDWYYSLGRSVRYAPGSMEARFIIEDQDQDGLFGGSDPISLIDAQTAGRYSFQNLHDRVENYGYNFNYPMTLGRWETEFKFGADFVTKTRTAENRRFDVNTLAFANREDLLGDNFGDILSDDVLANGEFNDNRPIIRDTTIAGDDYVAGQKLDAYYFEADFFFDNKWRFTGGVRWEDFRQVVAPFDPRSNQIDIDDEADRSQLAFEEDAFYPALALTYFLNDDMQLRASVGETVVRPDLREVSSATYIDPLTEFPIAGTPGLKTTDIVNYDLRWEWYREAGNNLSVALFYKDMTSPIESVQSPAQDGPPLIRIANAESGEVLGVEVEFLQGLEIFGDGIWDNLFTSGNITISDSEIVLDRQNIVEQTGVSTAITNTTRRLTGHSEYVVNLQLGYDSDNGEHSASLVYNVFGERILIPGIDGFDDNYEKPFHSLDTVYKYYPDFNTTITLKLKNILGEEKEIEFEDTLLRSETKGTEISLSYKYNF
ncbi:hypothetical protein HMF8227_00703 [Saliniradius amylolyticus]|uniref:TonB-dependent receptor n=1 Tax=Saliniradius amylolyticus TaxID=2183582 RepID=A0A2S2E0S8_9ALTE|nr:TonB-dependent receptor [Saliniradius amylolyticus]AWL11199.1 hypothetical protein HMF8227_00703 [Saliniradius amylolyticus]